MTVRYCGPRRKPDAPYGFVADPVALARESDFLMIACKGGPETQHLVSAAVIAALGATGTLINVARGSVVDEAALIAALRDGRLGAAALDVFATEPHVSPELLALPNVDRAAASRRRDDRGPRGDRPSGDRQHRRQARRATAADAGDPR